MHQESQFDTAYHEHLSFFTTHSFTKAAEELNVTPGAISQHIRQLEDYAGTPLFKRTGRSVLLTDAAQAALPMVRDAFDQIAEALG